MQQVGFGRLISVFFLGGRGGYIFKVEVVERRKDPHHISAVGFCLNSHFFLLVAEIAHISRVSSFAMILFLHQRDGTYSQACVFEELQRREILC